MATARGIPTALTSRCAQSVTIGEVPESLTAIGIATSTRSHAASVLHTVALNLEVTSDASLIGRVARKIALLAVAATKTAMNGGVSSTPTRVSKTIAGVSRKGKSRASSNGSRIATSAGSERPYSRHSNHSWARAAEEKRDWTIA